MDSALLESLLFRAEGDALDFKADNYSLDTDGEKAEFIKDILAFSNSWRDSDAYILLGFAEPVGGGKAQVSGITKERDDNSLQNLLKDKTQRAVRFSYEQFIFNEKKCAAVRIQVQERPFFLLKPFDKLKANTVYIRHGSVTHEASPDEIALMGRVKSRVAGPEFSVTVWPQGEFDGYNYPHFLLIACITNKGETTAQEVVVDFDQEPEKVRPHTETLWRRNISATARRSIAAQNPMHREAMIRLSSWLLDGSKFQKSERGDWKLQSYDGLGVNINLKIYSRDHLPVYVKIVFPPQSIQDMEAKEFHSTVEP